MLNYNHNQIEKKWQDYWDENKTFKTNDNLGQKKFYALDMFPYPSGAGLHVGHPEGYTATDIISRYKRMQGYNVLHPMGWDAFGLPAEQYALDTGNDPREFTKKNIQTFKRQIKELGFSYDWDREVNTTDPEYYKWTQWIFIQLYNKGLAYVDEVAVNWCPALGTVLSNEEVIDGVSERGGHPVYRKPMKQWVLKITEYADQLLADLDDLDWPESLKDMQRNWIGRSEGAKVSFDVDNTEGKVEVFTTRPDTIYGASFLVLSPEHALVNSITTDEYKEKVKAYQTEASKKSDLERTDLAKDKSVCLLVHMQLILYLVKKYKFGLLIMYYQHMVLEQLWQYQRMMTEIMNLLKSLICQSLKSSKVEMLKKQHTLVKVNILILVNLMV